MNTKKDQTKKTILENKKSKSNDSAKTKKPYVVGGIKKIDLEKIEEEICSQNVYLNVFAGSDLAFKENVEVLNSVLPSLEKLNCIKFDYNTNDFSHLNFAETKQIGVVADELEKVFPELVVKNEQGYRFVNYANLSAVAIQAVKELSTELKEKEDRIARLEKIVEDLVSKKN